MPFFPPRLVLTSKQVWDILLLGAMPQTVLQRFSFLPCSWSPMSVCSIPVPASLPPPRHPPPLSLILPCLGGFLIVSRGGGWWRLTASSSFLVSQGAVIGIDDEDDSTFTITVDQKTFHFQGESLVFFSPPLSLTSHSADSHVVWSKSVNAAYGRPLACRLSL